LFSAKILGLNTESDEHEQEEIDKPFEKLFKGAAKNHNLAIEQFKMYNFSKAIDIYRTWIEKLESVRMKTDEEEGKQKRLLIKMYQNICVCYNKIEKPEKTCIMMRELEKLIPIGNNPKALYAKAKANMMLNNFREARRYFMVAERLAPNDTSVSNALLELNRREEAKLKFETEQEDLVRKFQSEALQIADENQKKAKKQLQIQKELNWGLEKFKVKMEEKIAALRSDDAIESLNVTTDFAITHHHIEAADEMCQQQQIQLKGTQMMTGDKTLYYLKK
jgi:tetratricopeptide (TPR) repeat protein